MVTHESRWRDVRMKYIPVIYKYILVYLWGDIIILILVYRTIPGVNFCTNTPVIQVCGSLEHVLAQTGSFSCFRTPARVFWKAKDYEYPIIHCMYENIQPWRTIYWRNQRILLMIHRAGDGRRSTQFEETRRTKEQKVSRAYDIVRNHISRMLQW